MDPHSYFQLLCMTALVDGALQAEEKPLLGQYAQSLGIDQNKAYAMLQEVMANPKKPIKLPKSPTERDIVFRGVVSIIVADRHVAQEEYKLLRRIGKKFGIGEDQLGPILQRAMYNVVQDDPLLKLNAPQNLSSASPVRSPAPAPAPKAPAKRQQPKPKTEHPLEFELLPERGPEVETDHSGGEAIGTPIEDDEPRRSRGRGRGRGRRRRAPEPEIEEGGGGGFSQGELRAMGTAASRVKLFSYLLFGIGGLSGIASCLSAALINPGAIGSFLMAGIILAFGYLNKQVADAFQRAAEGRRRGRGHFVQGIRSMTTVYTFALVLLVLYILFILGLIVFLVVVVGTQLRPR